LTKPKYIKKLTRPITPGIIQLAQSGSFEDWLKSDQPRKEFISRMYDLLDHYKIDASQENCWFELACDLAVDHVKGLTLKPSYKKPGRPKKIDSASKQSSNGRGRPKKHTLEDAIELVRIVDGKKQELGLERKGRVTDAETLRHLISHYAKSTKKSVLVVLAANLSNYQKRLSESRKKILENTE
jgi:hypothetical protein